MKVRLLRCYILRGTKKWDFHIFVHDWRIRCEKDFSEDVFWFSIPESSQLPLQICWWFMKYSNQLSCKYFRKNLFMYVWIGYWSVIFIAMFNKQLIFCFIFSFKYSWYIRILYMSKFFANIWQVFCGCMLFLLILSVFSRLWHDLTNLQLNRPVTLRFSQLKWGSDMFFLYDRSCIDIFRIYVPPQILK